MNRLAWWLVCTTILISPITMMGGAPSVLLLFDFLCLIACSVAITSDRLLIGERFVKFITLPFLIILIYLTFQIIPLPPDLLKHFAPETWINYQETIWRLRPGVWMPISVHAENTFYAGFHVISLWALCIAFAFLVSSHLRLLQFIQFIVLAIVVWMALIVFVPQIGQYAWVSFYKFFGSRQNVINILGLWIVIFLPLVIAGWSACRGNNTHVLHPQKLKNFLKKPELPPHFLFLFGVGIASLGLLFLWSPFLWISMLTGYLLFHSIKSLHFKSQGLISVKIICFVTFLCVIGLISFAVLFPLGSAVLDTLNPEFSWFGHGVGAYGNIETVSAEMGGGEEHVIPKGGIKELLESAGSLGAVIFGFAIFNLFRITGGDNRINQSDKIACNIYSGGIAGLVLLLIICSLNSLWGWQAITTSVIYMILVAAWSKRLSFLLKNQRSHLVPLWKARFLKTFIGLVLIVGALLFISKVTPLILTTYEGGRLYDSYTSVNNSAGTWLKYFQKILPYNGDLSALIGQWYLVEHRDQEARVAILSALRMQPLSPQAHIAVASLSACSGDIDEATHFFSTKAARQYQPNEMTKLLLARLLKLNELDAAIKLANLSLDRSPQLAGLYLNLMTLYGYDSVSLKPLLSQQPLVMFALGNLQLSEGHKAEAENTYWAAIYSKGKGLSRDESLYIRIAKYFSEDGRHNEALIVAREGHEHYPESQGLNSLIANLRTQTGSKTN